MNFNPPYSLFRNWCCALLFLLWATPALAQDPAIKPDSLGIYTITEIPAEFPGGFEALSKFVVNNMHYPKIDEEEQSPVSPHARFVINEDGSATDAVITKTSGSKEIDRAVVDMIHKLPKFRPAMHNGKAVKSYYYFPLGCILVK